MKKIIFSAIFTLLCINGHCQQTKLHVPAHVRRFDTGYSPAFLPNAVIDVYEPDIQIKQIWDSLLYFSKNKHTIATLKKSTGCKTFESFIDDDKNAYIIYDDDILYQYSDDPDYAWMVKFILAHELAHFALGHDNRYGANKEYEEHADEWACDMLCQMGANADQAKQAIKNFVPDFGTHVPGYPPRKQRIRAIDTFYKRNNCLVAENKTVKIGDQIWMTKNLDVDHYNNGNKILEAHNWDEMKCFGSLKTGCWAYYEFDKGYAKMSGRLYNYYVISDPRGIAPNGFRVPTEGDILILRNFLKIGKTNSKYDKSGYEDRLLQVALTGYSDVNRLRFLFLGDVSRWWYNQLATKESLSFNFNILEITLGKYLENIANTSFVELNSIRLIAD